MRLLLSLLLLVVTPARGDDFMGELQSNLVRFIAAHASFEQDPRDRNLDALTTAEAKVVDQIFSKEKDEKLYTAALEEVNRRGGVAPMAISYLGNSLQTKWEQRHRVAFYEVQMQRRDLYQIPHDALLLAGSVMTGKAMNPEGVTRYFSSVRKLWAEGTLLGTSGGYVIRGSTMLTDVPRPPADVIVFAQHQLLDFRARELAAAQHRKNIAEQLGFLAGAGTAVALGGQIATKNPWGIAATALLVGGLGLKVGMTTADIAEWSFAAASEESLEQEVATMMQWLFIAERATREGNAGTQDGVPVRLAAARALADAVNRLHANRNLDFLLAEIPYLAELNALEAKYGRDESPDRDLRLSQSTAAYVTKLKELMAKRKPPLFDPRTTKWLGRQWLKATRLSPFVAAERQTLKDQVNRWPSPIREYGVYWANVGNASEGLTAEAGLKRFHQMLDEEASKSVADLLKRTETNRPTKCPSCPTRSDIAKGSDAVYLQAAAFIRSMNDPALENIAAQLENRVTGIVSRLLNADAPLPPSPASPERLIQTVDRYLDVYRSETAKGPNMANMVFAEAMNPKGDKIELDRLQELLSASLRKHEAEDWGNEASFKDLDRVAIRPELQEIGKDLLGKRANYRLVTSLGGTCYRIALAKNADHNEMVRRLVVRYSDRPEERDALFALLTCVTRLVEPQVEARNKDLDVLISRVQDGIGTASLILLFYDWRAKNYPGWAPFKQQTQAAWESLVKRFPRPGAQAESAAKKAAETANLSESRALVPTSRAQAAPRPAPAAEAASADAARTAQSGQAPPVKLPEKAPTVRGWAIGMATQFVWNLSRATVGGIGIGGYTLYEQSEVGKIHPTQVMKLAQLKAIGEIWLKAEAIAKSARELAQELKKPGVKEEQRVAARGKLKELVLGYDIQEKKGEQFSSSHVMGYTDLKSQIAHLDAHANEFSGLTNFPNTEKQIKAYREKFEALKLLHFPEERVTAFLAESEALEARIALVDRQIFAEAAARDFGPGVDVKVSLAELKMQLLSAEEALEAAAELVRPKDKPAKRKAQPKPPVVPSPVVPAAVAGEAMVVGPTPQAEY